MSYSILLAVDGSPCSRHAVRYALRRLAMASADSEIHLMHVNYRIPSRAASAVGREVVEGYYRAESAKAVRPACRLLDSAGIRYRIVRAVGEPGTEISRYAKNHDIDLIVMGTHGNGTGRRLLMGSVAQSAIASTDLPVLVVRGSGKGGDGGVLVPVDGSRFTRHALNYFADNVELYAPDGRVTVLHVSYPPQRLAISNKAAGRDYLKQTCESVMAPARRRLAKAGIKCREVALAGDPGDQIAAYARRWKPDLILMGSHGRTAMTELFLGSVTQKALSGTRTAFLIVR
jgi:nucleotide-binding universal stress UspA family protein